MPRAAAKIVCPGPVSRRSFLQMGATGALGLGAIEKARASIQGSHPDTSVIFVWLPGGPPHMETYDMKPDAPLDYRGEFRPIRSNVPGIDVCELLPLHARCADKYTLVRSVHHTFADHGGGHKRFLTGRIPATPTGFVNDAPCVASLASKVLEQKANPSGLANYIVTGNGRVNNVDTFSFGSAYLGSATHPFAISADPNEEGFEVKNLSIVDGVTPRRLDDRVSLLKGIDRLRRDLDSSGAIDSLDALNGKAISMVTSPKARKAFDLSKETDAVRDRYGRHEWGQRALMARRLVEAGVSWVTVVMENPYASGIKMPDYGTYNWDSHAVNCHLFNDARIRLPLYDRVITALVEDLHARGLNKKVLLVVTGEFGRTPRINERPGTKTKIAQPGRDHWPRAMSMLLSGGGMQTGQVVGSTNSKGEEPKERPLTPNDLWATVFRHLGVDYEKSFDDLTGRPMPILPFGSPIEELRPVS